MKTFNRREAINYGWREAKRHWWKFALAVVALLIVSGLSGGAEEFSKHTNASSFFSLFTPVWTIGLIGSSLLLLVINNLIYIALYKLSLDSVQPGRDPSLNHLLPSGKTTWRVWVNGVVQQIVMMLPIILMLVLAVGLVATIYVPLVNDTSGWALLPVIVIGGPIFILISSLVTGYLTVRLLFVPYITLYRSVWFSEAAGESWRYTRGNFWSLVWFITLLALINAVGLMCLFVGIFFTLPLTLIALAHAYWQLSGNALSEGSDIPRPDLPGGEMVPEPPRPSDVSIPTPPSFS